MNMRPYHLIAPKLFLAVIGSLTFGVLPSVAQPAPPPIGVLRLASGDHLAGSLYGTDQAAELVWQHPQFESPFRFKLTDVIGAYFTRPADLPLAQGDFGIELWGGDLLFGSIVGNDDQVIRVSSGQLGDIEVSRKSVRRIYRWNNGVGVTVVDCGSLNGWTVGSDAKDVWSEMGGQLRTKQSGATLFRDVAMPAKARIDVELAWENQPNFIAAFGVDVKEPATAAAAAFRIEVWDKQLVAVWERDDLADIAVLGGVAEFNQELRLTIDFDQVSSTATLISDQGRVIAKIALKTGTESAVAPGFWLENITGTVSLNRLQVTRGDLALDGDHDKDADRIYLKEEKGFTGSWVGVEDKDWVFREGERERRYPADKVLQVEMSSPQSDAQIAIDDPALTQLRTIEGVRLTGLVESIVDAGLSFRPTALSSSIALPISRIERLSAVNTKTLKPNRLALGVARFETADSRLHVRLADLKPGSLPTSLRLEPLGATSALLRPAFSGRLVYQDPPPKPTANGQQIRVVQPQRPAGILGAVVSIFGSSNAAAQSTGRKLMYLRSGEVIPCEVEGIDEKSVTFKSSMTTQTQVPRDQVRALQLVSGRGEPVLDQLKRERLLTVPRMRKNSPPTHLIVATNGDVMRCRLKEMTAKCFRLKRDWRQLRSIESLSLKSFGLIQRR